MRRNILGNGNAKHGGPGLFGKVAGGVNTFTTLAYGADTVRRLLRRPELEEDVEGAFEDMEAEESSEQLENDRLASLQDYLARDFSLDEGIYCAHFGGYNLHYSGNGSIILYGPPGTGKFRDFLAQNVYKLTNRTLLIADPKCEVYLRSKDHRGRVQGDERQIVLAPMNAHGIVSNCYNPLSRIIRMAQAGEDFIDELENFVEVTHETDEKQNVTGDTEWVKDQSKELAMIYWGGSAPVNSQCTMGGLWDFASCNRQLFFHIIEWVKNSPDTPPAIQMMADTFLTDQVRKHVREEYADEDPDPNDEEQAHKFVWLNVDKSGRDEVKWIRSRLRKTVSLYRPGSDYRCITDRTDFDVTGFRKIPGTIYFALSGSNSSAGKKWASLTANALIKELAQADGPVKCTMLMDELTTIPAIKDYDRMVLEYRSRGCQFVSICHSRQAMDRVYGKEVRQSLENAAAVKIFWDQSGDVELCEEVSRLAGSHTIAVMSPSVSSSADLDTPSYGRQFQSVKNLTTSQVAGISNGLQIMISHGYPSVGFTQRVPYYADPDCNEAILPPIETLG